MIEYSDIPPGGFEEEVYEKHEKPTRNNLNDGSFASFLLTHDYAIIKYINQYFIEHA